MCLGLANGYIEPKKKSGSASLVDGHIDPIESELESDYAKLKEKYFGGESDTE